MTQTLQKDPIQIFYPNGGTSSVQVYIWDGTKPVIWDGSVTFSGSLPSTVAGNLTNNNAAPTSNNLGALTAVANAAAPTWTEGRQVLLSTDLAGNLRVAATISTAGLATSSNQTNGNQKTQIVDGSGNVIASTSNALNVAITAGSAVIGHVITDTGSTTVVTGNVTVVQATGTNLHTVIDSGTITTVTAVTAITNALPAGTNLLGQISASNETSTVYNGTTALTPKFATIAASSSGNNTLVASVSSKKIRVVAYNFISNGTVNAKFQSGAGGTDLTGLKYCIANMGICAPFNPVGWFETAATTLLNLNLSSGVAVGGELVYVEV